MKPRDIYVHYYRLNINHLLNIHLLNIGRLLLNIDDFY